MDITFKVLSSKSRNKDYNVMIDGKTFFDQPMNSDFKTYENIKRITTGK